MDIIEIQMAMTSLTHMQYIAELRKSVFENKLGHQ